MAPQQLRLLRARQRGAHPEQRIAEASVVVPARAGITGWAALRWMGGRWFDGKACGGREALPVTIATGGGSARMRPQPGIAVCAERLTADDLIVVDGLRLTGAAWSISFAMRHAPSETEAAVVMDMAALSNLASIAEVAAHLAAHPGLLGSAQARTALGLAHENSWSPMETRLRMVWLLLADLPEPRVNRPVFDLDEHHLATPDLFDEEAGLAVEYDGADVHEGVRRLRDNDREDALRGAGLSHLTVLKGEFGNRRKLAERLRRARAAALAARTTRRWTVEPPRGWELWDTVESRRRDR